MLITVLLTLALFACLLAPAATASAGPSRAASADPLALLAVQQAQLSGSAGATVHEFGFSVAIFGDTALVGAPQEAIGSNANQGSAYVFVRAGTSWSQQARLLASDGAAEDYFGWSVAISGDTAVVGAPYHMVGTQANQGAAYVFVRSGTSWSQQAQLWVASGAAADHFGASVAVSGDTTAVGAPWTTVGANTAQGAAYVFVRTGTSWSPQATLTASDGAATEWFGDSLALSGDTALVGGPYDTVSLSSQQGAAYVFVRSGTSWSQQAKLAEDAGGPNDFFGLTVALSGDTALVGAQWNAVGANTAQGAAYVFVRSGTSWSQQAQLVASDGATNDQFGASVAVSGDTALVGAWVKGAAYAFVRTGTSWSQQAQLTVPGGDAYEDFGFSVALSGETALVGEPWGTVGDMALLGAAYPFLLGPSDTTPPTTTPSGVPVAWSKTPATVTLSATDDLSGVASTEYRLQGASGWTLYSAPFAVTAEGISTYEYRSTDYAGNVETTKTFSVKIDTSPPTTTITGLPSGWVNQSVPLSLSASDTLSGFAYSEYSLNGGAFSRATSLTVSTAGTTTIGYDSADNAGNLETIHTATVRIDTGKPTATATKNVTVKKGKKATLAFKVSDPAPSCGTATVTITIKLKKKTVKTIMIAKVTTNRAGSYSFKVSLKRGSYLWSVQATDIAGNAGKASTAKKLIVK